MDEFDPKLREAMRSWKPYLIAVEKLVSELQFGQLDITLRVHEGFVTDIVTAREKKRQQFKMPKREVPAKIGTDDPFALGLQH